MIIYIYMSLQLPKNTWIMENQSFPESSLSMRCKSCTWIYPCLWFYILYSWLPLPSGSAVCFWRDSISPINKTCQASGQINQVFNSNTIKYPKNNTFRMVPPYRPSWFQDRACVWSRKNMPQISITESETRHFPMIWVSCIHNHSFGHETVYQK